ncbi:hypothetical protein CcaCcLH18_10325 [Colletotrichum camelliae]|nr:hypothetical protein CcaCcLH18_10325 [Colletotrichum camelliae]
MSDSPDGEKYDPKTYTVGWICAIGTEFTAAKTFLERRHATPPVALNDNNNYALGMIGGHHVVMAVLPNREYGTSSAAVVARDMLHSFPNVRIGLMLPPGDERRRLQYDFGKVVQNQSDPFEYSGHLNQPPPVLRTAVESLESTYEMEGHTLGKNIEKALQPWKRLHKKYSRPSSDTDRLYISTVIHPDSPGTCKDLCKDDPASLVSRNQREEEEDDPKIHYGLIASANQVMKNSEIRDRLATNFGVLCFEMEAAGLMNHFPCLVVRGICDYSDSHKNDDWMGFAAMTAAAYTADLLHQVPIQKIEKEESLIEIMKQVKEGVECIGPDVESIKTAVTDERNAQTRDRISRWLSPSDPATNLRQALARRNEHTGSWFLDSKLLAKWKNGELQHLWLYGLSGSGKTILSAALIQDLITNNTLDTPPTLMYFFDFSVAEKQTLDSLLKSLVWQLFNIGGDAAGYLNKLFESNRNGLTQPNITGLWDCLVSMTREIGRVNIVIDALDECSTRNELVSWIEGVAARPRLPEIHMILTGRPRDAISYLDHSTFSGMDHAQASPLFFACHAGLYNVASKLIKDGLDVKSLDAPNRRPLHAAAASGHAKVVELLIENGAEVDAEDNTGETCLCVASSQGHTAVVQILLDNGAIANSAVWSGQGKGNALSNARYNGHADVVKLLLEHGARDMLSGERHHRWFVEDSNLSDAEKVEVARPMLELGIYAAAERGDKKELAGLLMWDGEISLPADWHYRPTVVASRNGHSGVVQVIQGERLYQAAFHNEYDIAKELLDAGASPDGRSVDGDTALEAAGTGGHLELVKLLLGRGASVSKALSYGSSLVRYSESVEWPVNQEVLDLLRQHEDRSTVTMENDIVVGVGARAATVDRYDFAEAALSQVFSIALELATNKSLCVAGRLAAQLHIARGAVGSAADPKLHSRILKLLRDLEHVCAWPDVPSDRLIITQALVHHEQRAKDRVQKGIINFAKSSKNKFEKPLTEQYFKNLSRFSEGILANDNMRNVINKTGPKSAADEYPMHINAELYTILKTYSLCTCVSNHNSGRSRHYARLRLQDKMVKIEENVAFEMLFSESPTTCHHWQHFQLRVPLRRKSAKAVNFNHEASCQIAPGSPGKSKRKMWVVKPDEFCNLVASKVGSRICCHIQDSKLHRLRRGLEITQNVKAGDSLSLRDLFILGRLSNHMKLRLAYIVARSFWQYYDSPWMGSSWTSDSVHFLRESSTGHNHPRGEIYATKPYFAVDFNELDHESIEYCDEPGVVFPYPRLLSLCIILLEIGRGQAITIEDKGSVVANLNERWHLAKRLMKPVKGRHGFDYVDFQEAIASCLNNSSWEEDSDSIETDVFARKAVIYDIIVQPLEKLLENCFSDTQHGAGPVDQSGALSEFLALPEAPAMPKTSSEVDESERWIDLMKRINEHFLKMLSPETLVQRPRVAILDTGFDGSSSFLDVQGRRIEHWKDFAETSQEPVDEAGHGTHTAATAMKVAPRARICVARIAKDVSSLSKAPQAIAEAIDWAANQVNVDIISMSFGFPSEVPVITAAIRKAILDRNGSLIFFAAASNAGGNGKEMFPANLDEVFSIRETNSRGAFSDTNPPVNPNGPIVFGTLGRDVPAASLSTARGEVPKSGSSVATAVAAGIAASLLMIGDVGVEEDCLTPAEASRLRTKSGEFWLAQT